MSKEEFEQMWAKNFLNEMFSAVVERVAVGKGVLSAALSNKDVLKPKEFVRTISTCDVDNFLWRMENYFCTKGIMDDAVKEVEQRCAQKLSEAMTIVESVVKLGSSKSEEMGVCEKDHKEYVVDGNDDNGGNRKPQVGKKKLNRKRDKLKYFLYDDPHILRNVQKNPCFLRKRSRWVRLRKCPMKFVIEGDDGANKEPKKLELSKASLRKGKATFELGESLEGLSPKEDVSLSSNLGENVAMKTMKLEPLRLNSSGASELIESSTRLPPMRDGWCIGLQGKRSDTRWIVDQNKCNE
ncbi:hypothetical protein J1N35_004510 [Gossypium stocksii]|uniref:Uncharacterized protein n=1 Tax=Gossypium stocksii TaxID=47602 RepID=A0A9D3WEA1_9ROSI|nr:hypothetical protein J1N35_004510 [Gossypium stocksii]